MNDTIKMFSMTKEELIKHANITKEVVFGALYNHGFLTMEQHEDLVQHWAVVIVDESPTFGQRIRKWFGYATDHPKGQQTYTMVKFLSKVDDSEE